MLILTRRTGEGIEIEGGVTIKVLHTQRGRVRLGIVAPKSMRVNRAEAVNAEARNGQADADPYSIADSSGQPGS